MSNIPPEVWDDFSKDVYGATGRVILEIFLAGGKSGLKQLPPRLIALQDWEYYSRAAQQYLNLYRLNTVPNLMETTKRNAVRIIGEWIESGDPLDMLITRLEPWLGTSRAGRIAVTEVTRTYAAGNIASWKSTQLVGGKRWATANDELVCPICGPLDGRVVEIDNDFRLAADGPLEGIPEADLVYYSPPAHPNCRCWLQPFVSEELLRKSIEEGD
jgi:SPP1 gp7 family putative phage head morphogenesis protein